MRYYLVGCSGVRYYLVGCSGGEEEMVLLLATA